MKISQIEIPTKAPETFEELCSLFLLRLIHDEAENAEMIRVMDWIAVRAQNRDQFDYAKMLGSLVTGARSITVDHARRASRYFKMAPEAFLDLHEPGICLRFVKQNVL